MLMNLLISSYVLFYRLKNDNFNYKNNIKFILEVVIQIVLFIISFSLIMSNFYILLIIVTNIIHIIYITCIFDQRTDVEYELKSAV